MEAVYSVTVLFNVYCDEEYGARASTQGETPQDSAMLYVFDSKIRAESIGGAKKQFMPYEEWINCDEKADYWTFNKDNEKDYFIKGVCDCKNPTEHSGVFKITKAHRYAVGTSRMRHWEVNGS